MTSKKQKEKKKKEREKIAKNRVLKRREALRKQKKELAMEQKQEKLAEESAYGKQKPFLKNDTSVLSEVLKENKEEEIRKKIEHNLKILEALEQEYDIENSQRKEINQKLENEGFMTMKEKMDALHRRALELEGKSTELEQAQKEYDQIELEQAQKDYDSIVEAISCEITTNEEIKNQIIEEINPENESKE